MMETTEYDLIVLYLMGSYSPPFPQLYCDTFYFEKLELEANWNKIMHNKEVLDNALQVGRPPAPFQHCYDWECKHCRYKLVCGTIAKAMGVENKLVEEDKENWE